MLTQIILAITLVVILFIIGFTIYNKEFLFNLKKSNNTKISIPIFSGFRDFKDASDIEYNTTNIFSGSYIPINKVPSANQKAGAEYSYNFWMYKDNDKYTKLCNKLSIKKDIDNGFDITDNLGEGINGNYQTILFLKGDKRVQEYENICSRDNNKIIKKDIMIKNPLVKLEQCGKHLTVEFNTLQSKDVVTEKAGLSVCDKKKTTWRDANSHKLTLSGLDKPEFNRKWVMVTLVIQDTYPSDPYPVRNKVRCRIYFNGQLELDRYVNGRLTAQGATDDITTLKLNDGNLYVAPRVSIVDNNKTYSTYKPDKPRELMMSDLTYFNYSLDESEIERIFNKGPNKKAAPTPSGDTIEIMEVAPKPMAKQLDE